MASWVNYDKKDKHDPTRYWPPMQSSPHEDGQTCPHCGDLSSWRCTYCQSCGTKLA